MAELKSKAETDPRWRAPDGSLISCTEKIKVLRENLEEIKALAQDALEDAVLMGCDDAQVRAIFAETMQTLQNPYRK
jgi:hypothetical protein